MKRSPACMYPVGLAWEQQLDSDEWMSRFFIYLGASERFLHVANES